MISRIDGFSSLGIGCFLEFSIAGRNILELRNGVGKAGVSEEYSCLVTVEGALLVWYIELLACIFGCGYRLQMIVHS